MKKEDEYVCIYCKNRKSVKDFNREHVIPELFGKFGSQTMTLLRVVCRSCNDYFSKNLENVLGRDSIFGILYRVLSGLLKPDSFSKTIKTKRKRLEAIIHDADHHGVLFDLELTDDGRFSCEVANQVMVMNSTKGVRLSFRLNSDFPHRSKLEGVGLKPKSEFMKFLFKKDVSSPLQECNAIFRRSEIKISLLPSEFGAFSFDNKAQPLQFRFIADTEIARVFAKIVFNYFAYKTSAQNVLEEDFDAIRNFIRYGLLSDREIVKVYIKNTCFDMSNIQHDSYAKHSINIVRANRYVMGKMWLFGEVYVEVVLSSKQKIITLNSVPIASNVFNISEKNIV